MHVNARHQFVAVHATVDESGCALPSGLVVKYALCGLQVPARETIAPYVNDGGEETDGEPVVTPCWVGVTCDACKATHIDHTIGTI